MREIRKLSPDKVIQVIIFKKKCACGSGAPSRFKCEAVVGRGKLCEGLLCRACRVRRNGVVVCRTHYDEAERLERETKARRAPKKKPKKGKRRD